MWFSVKMLFSGLYHFLRKCLLKIDNHHSRWDCHAAMLQQCLDFERIYKSYGTLISSLFFRSIQGFQAMLGRFSVRLVLTGSLNLPRLCKSKYWCGIWNGTWGLWNPTPKKKLLLLFWRSSWWVELFHLEIKVHVWK